MPSPEPDGRHDRPGQSELTARPKNPSRTAPPNRPEFPNRLEFLNRPEFPSRRQFLGAVGIPMVGAAAIGISSRRACGQAMDALAAIANTTPPAALAADEEIWFDLAQAFTVDRTMINLNNGGVSPSPAIVQQAMKRHLDFSNTAPPYAMWRVLEPRREALRKNFARTFGCDAEEIAFTRNASESLQTCQFGLDLRAGDEVLTSNQDYPRMLTTFRQRARREGIVLKEISLPVPLEDKATAVRLFEEAMTDKTRLMLICHMINLTGQVLPVREIVAAARKRNIPVIVDGAHALAHIDFQLGDLDCDYYGSSLHKWLFAPHGTGMLYVRRNKIGDLWPLMAANEEMKDDIRKFEEIGTHPAANYMAIGEALTFHHGIGPKRKEARMVYLRDYWTGRLLSLDRVKLHTSLKPGWAYGIATVEIDGIESPALSDWLWREHKIITSPIVHDEFQGVRISPSVYTTTDELDRFCDAMTAAATKGIPEKPA